MVGKSAEGQPLSGKEMMEDVMSDYANRTVTIENHPHVSGPHASIHPWYVLSSSFHALIDGFALWPHNNIYFQISQHGKVMRTIVKNLIKSSAADGEEHKEPSVEMYLFIFLKFVSSIIPTINYDFTMDVTADTSK